MNKLKETVRSAYKILLKYRQEKLEFYDKWAGSYFADPEVHYECSYCEDRCHCKHSFHKSTCQNLAKKEENDTRDEGNEPP